MGLSVDFEQFPLFLLLAVANIAELLDELAIKYLVGVVLASSRAKHHATVFGQGLEYRQQIQGLVVQDCLVLVLNNHLEVAVCHFFVGLHYDSYHEVEHDDVQEEGLHEKDQPDESDVHLEDY